MKLTALFLALLAFQTILQPSAQAAARDEKKIESIENGALLNDEAPMLEQMIREKIPVVAGIWGVAQNDVFADPNYDNPRKAGDTRYFSKVISKGTRCLVTRDSQFMPSQWSPAGTLTSPKTALHVIFEKPVSKVALVRVENNFQSGGSLCPNNTRLLVSLQDLNELRAQAEAEGLR